MAIFFIIGSIFLACRSAWSGERFHFCAIAESAAPLHAAPAHPLGGLVVGRSLARVSRHERPSPKPPCSRPPLGGSPKLLFLAIACRYAVFRIREKQRLHSLFSLMPNPASPRPPSLRSHGVVLFGSLLSPIRPPPSALAPAAPSGGAL